MQFNARTTPQTVEAFYAIADRQGGLVGETLELEHAVAPPQREIAGSGRLAGSAPARRPLYQLLPGRSPSAQ